MIISKVENFEQANLYFINPLINSYYFSDTKKHVIAHDAFTFDCIQTGDFEKLRQGLESVNYEELVNQHFVNREVLPDFSQDGITEHPTVAQYIYPYSRTHLFKNVYAFILPSLVDLYFQYMKTTGRIKQIGTGAGKALYFKPVPFSQEEFQNIKQDSVDYNDVIKLMTKVVSQYSQQTADIEYLLDLVKNHESVNQDLLAQLEQSQNNWMTSINHTWR